MRGSRSPPCSRSSRVCPAWSSRRSRPSSRISASPPPAITTACAGWPSRTSASPWSAGRPTPRPASAPPSRHRGRPCRAAEPSRPRRFAAPYPRACSAPSRSSASARTAAASSSCPPMRRSAPPSAGTSASTTPSSRSRSPRTVRTPSPWWAWRGRWPPSPARPSASRRSPSRKGRPTRPGSPRWRFSIPIWALAMPRA